MKHPPSFGVTGPFSRNALGKLQAAIDWWQVQGFVYVDLPWLVPKAHADAVRPPEREDYGTPYGSLVGSGEQSFVWLRDSGWLPEGEPGYIGWTPCFRDEGSIGVLHQHAFMKAEWFIPLGAGCSGQKELLDAVSMQMRAFRSLLSAEGGRVPSTALRVISSTSNIGEIDIELGGIEIGSYGVRAFNQQRYVYGTALALPRYDVALDRLNLSRA